VTSRGARLVLAIGVAAWIANAALLVWRSPALGFDESQYANAASDLLDGIPQRRFYLSAGMEVIAVPGIELGASDRDMRLLPLCAGLALIAAAWWLARRATDATTAAWTVAAIAATRSIARRGADLLSDIPAAACLVAATALVVSELTRADGPRWRLCAAAPLGAAALYVRYGSCIPIAVIALAALVLGFPAIRRRPAPALATVALFLVLLVPHALSAIDVTGKPWGLLLDASSVPGRGYIGDGLVAYVTTNPIRFYGTVVPPILVAGVLAIGWARDRRRAMLWMCAVGDVLGVGLVSHAESRYIFYALVLLIILGVDLIRRMIAAAPGHARLAIGALAAAALAWAWLLVANASTKYARVRAAETEDITEAIAAIRADDAGAPCQLIALHDPPIEWYSGCYAPLRFDPAVLAERRVYAVHDTAPNPEEPDLDALPGHHVVVHDSPRVRVIRLEPDPSP